MTDQSILAVARATRYDIGANRKDTRTGATWSFLLPNLPLGRIAVLGAPDPVSRQRLEELAQHTVDGAPAEERFDLIWLAAGDARPAPDRAMLRAGLTESGVILDERPDEGAAPASDAVRFRVLRRDGDTLVAIPAAFPAVDTWLRSRGLAGPEKADLRARWRRRVLAARRGTLPGSSPTWGCLDLIGQPGLERPPHYLRDLAASGGDDIGAHAWGLSAAGPYRTQKVLVPLFAPGAVVPEIIVKLARHPSVNGRLGVELDGLRRLASAGETIRERVPTVRFSGTHAGLLVVGESALDGVPFRAPRMQGHPLAADAVAWLTELGVRTAARVESGAAAAALDDLVDTYVAADGPGRALEGALRTQVERIRRHRGPFPVVVQHGDPGTWNLVAMPGDRTGFLDWENHEEQGMPLWDLFYLLRSLAVGSIPRRALERRLGHVERALFDSSERTPFIVDAVRRYCAQVGLADELVEPLFHLGWMFQALKEVTRLAPGRLGEGHFYALLRRGFERRANGTLDLLFKGTRT